MTATSTLYKAFLIGVLLMFIQACIEPYDFKNESFQDALVVEMTFTNIKKQHRLSLSRAGAFGTGFVPEQNATVTVADGEQSYGFVEVSPGSYVSESEFAAEPGKSYILNITTANGKTYVSNPEQLPPVVPLENIRAVRGFNDQEEEGVYIYANAYDPNDNAHYYRYEYDETYKLIAPKWSPEKLVPEYPEIPYGEVPTNPASCELKTVPKERDEKICYPTAASNTIIQTSTLNLTEDRVSDFPVRFISRKNYIIATRYSILVRQYVQSEAAYGFFNALKEVSGSNNVFSQTQPGFYEGNIKNTTDPDEQVLGYFEVSSLSEKRLFFNYEELFGGEELPPYFISCEDFAPVISRMGECVLRDGVETNTIRFYRDNPKVPDEEGPFAVVPRLCGDCTVLGTTDVPAFWVD